MEQRLWKHEIKYEGDEGEFNREKRVAHVSYGVDGWATILLLNDR